ncbi:MAG: cobalamin biosynthesis protein [Pseudomonadota bacterium]
MIVAGFGFTTRATAHSLTAALAATGYAGPLDRVATAAAKATAPCLTGFATARGIAVTPVPPAALQQQTPQTHSAQSMTAHGSGSVAEAAALAAAGPGATLIAPRSISADRMATCAIAKGPDA